MVMGMLKRGGLAVLFACVLVSSACGGGAVTVDDDASTGARDAGSVDEDAGGVGVPDASGGGDDADTPDADPGPAPEPTEVTVTLHADQGASDGLATFAVPMPPGLAMDAARVAVVDGADPAPAAYEVLATWPADGSLRSVLITLPVQLAQGAQKDLTVRVNAPRDTSTDLADAAPVLDGPVVGVLPASWYVGARVVTAPMQAAADSPHPAYEAELVENLFGMDPAYDSYGVSCGSTTSHRTYYDGPRAIYALFLRTGEPRLFRRARAEAAWFRANELEFSADRAYAYHTCQGEGWAPDERLSWSVLRRMTGQGMLDDYLLTGDPAAREAVVAMGDAFTANLPALRAPTSNDPYGSIQATERNLAWTMMGIASAYAVTGSDAHRGALVSLMDELVEWQNRGTSGALEHDIVRPDPSECSDGPAGASPFMTTLVVDAVMDYYGLVRDARAMGFVANVAAWMHDDARTTDGQTWRYLWGCASNDYADNPYNDLNLMMVHAYGAAYVATGDRAWIERGDALAGFGLQDMFTKRPKQWNQSSRTFGKWLGYRVADPAQERRGEVDVPGPMPR